MTRSPLFACESSRHCSSATGWRHRCRTARWLAWPQRLASGTWLLAGPPDGCARVTWTGEPLDAGGLVRLGTAYALTGLDGSQPWAEPADQASVPVPRLLTLIRAPGRTAPVDAVLLDDADLDCLPLAAGR